MAQKIHDYELIERIMQDHQGWTYGEIADEYVRQSGIPVTWTRMKVIIQRKRHLSALKRPPTSTPRQRRHDYDLIEALISLFPSWASMPVALAEEYNRWPPGRARECGAGTMKVILARRRARLAKMQGGTDEERRQEEGSASGVAGTSRHCDQPI